MDSNKLFTKAVIATLVYHDIFDYPLTIDEIQKYLIGTSCSLEKMHEGLHDKSIDHKGRYFFLQGRKEIVGVRLEREKISKKKLIKAKKIVRILKHIPWIVYIGVSGSLAMQNAKEADDIDLFIITHAGMLWTCRLLVNVLILLSGNLRRYGKTPVQDSICTNMWIDTQHIQFPKERQNIYTAHEIGQMITLFETEGMSKKFIAANSWIQHCLPNIPVGRYQAISFSHHLILSPLDKLAKFLQMWYMKRHLSSETIQEGFVAFHPKDYSPIVLRDFERKIKSYAV